MAYKRSSHARVLLAELVLVALFLLGSSMTPYGGALGHPWEAALAGGTAQQASHSCKLRGAARCWPAFRVQHARGLRACLCTRPTKNRTERWRALCPLSSFKPPRVMRVIRAAVCSAALRCLAHVPVIARPRSSRSSLRRHACLELTQNRQPQTLGARSAAQPAAASPEKPQAPAATAGTTTQTGVTTPKPAAAQPTATRSSAAQASSQTPPPPAQPAPAPSEATEETAATASGPA